MTESFTLALRALVVEDETTREEQLLTLIDDDTPCQINQSRTQAN